MKKTKITEKTTIEKILQMGGEKILEKHRLPCLHCPMAQMEIGYLKLGEVCDIYGLDLKKILKDLEKL